MVVFDPFFQHSGQSACDPLLVEGGPAGVEKRVDLDSIGCPDLLQHWQQNHRAHLRILAARLSVLGTGKNNRNSRITFLNMTIYFLITQQKTH